MKEYITKSFSAAESEVRRWQDFFAFSGIILQVEKIRLAPVLYSDDETPKAEESGFEPILVGVRRDNFSSADAENGMICESDYMRIREMLATGEYRRNVLGTGTTFCLHNKLADLDLPTTLRMLEEWARYMEKDGIVVGWKLSIVGQKRYASDNRKRGTWLDDERVVVPKEVKSLMNAIALDYLRPGSTVNSGGEVAINLMYDVVVTKSESAGIKLYNNSNKYINERLQKFFDSIGE